MTDALQIKFNELSLTDEDTQSKIDERYLRMKVITPNEVRIRKGMVPMDGGDEVVELKPQQQAEARAQAGNTMANKLIDKLGSRVSKIELDKKYKDIGDMLDSDILNTLNTKTISSIIGNL